MVTPSFSIGTTTATSPAIARRSTRRAAMIATTRIAEELAPQRRCTRLATRSNNNNRNSVRTLTELNDGTTAATTSASTSFTTATASISRSDGTSARTPELPPAPKGSPVVLDDDDIESMDLKPAAKVPVAEVAAALLPGQMSDFTCPICLDAPTSMTDVASISGCTHQFCFDCIDKWANTENRCPCCKARFRTIDRVVALPTSSIETPGQAASTTTTSGGRKGKRKKSSYSGSPNSQRRRGGSNASASYPDRPNSRTVEDRNQPSMQGLVIDAAFVQNILSTLMDATSVGRGGGGANSGGGAGQVTFVTSGDGRPVIRVINPQSGGMVGITEIHLSEGTQAQVGGGASATGGGAAGMSVRISRAPTSTDFPSVLPRRVTRPITAEWLQQLAAGRSAARGSEAANTAAAVGSRPAPASAAGEGTNGAFSGAPAQQPTSSFTNLFASRGDSTSASSSSPRGRRGAFSVGGSTSTNGAASGPSAASHPGRQVVTIRLISRPSHASPTRSTNRRTVSNTSQPDDEPIVID